MSEEKEFEKFDPKENVNFYMRFDVDAFKKDPNCCIYFEITDDNGNLKHKDLDLSGVSNDSLSVLVESLFSILENIIEPEIDKRNDKFFKKQLDSEIKYLLKSCNLKEGN